nr:RecQ family ATP-dependent DNA helicase [Aureibacillus halotolerans]
MLHSVFRLSELRSLQSEVIDAVLQRQDVLAVMPTGSGKSLCYQLPAYLLKGTILVITPLISLMEDQVRRLWNLGETSVAVLNGIKSWEERDDTLRRLHTFRFVFTSPEMLQNRRVLQALSRCSLSLMVIDEAHCISQWGHEFRTDYLRLGTARKQLGSPQCLALTATATTEVKADIVQELQLSSATHIVSAMDRGNIGLSVTCVKSEDERAQTALEWIQRFTGSGLVYFSSRKKAEQFARLVQDNTAIRIAVYHAGLTPEERTLVQQQFIQDEVQLVACTSAFGMGIDKSDVRFVLHYHLPSRIESYVQEMGRAGRDGEPSLAIALYAPEDDLLQHHFFQANLPMPEDLTFLKGYIETHGWTNAEKALSANPSPLPLSDDVRGFILFRMETHLEKEHFFTRLEEEIADRVQKKQRDWFRLRAWAFTEKCRRTTYLKMFDETGIHEVPTHLCCDQCGLEKDYFFAATPKEYDSAKIPWQDELRLLFRK